MWPASKSVKRKLCLRLCVLWPVFNQRIFHAGLLHLDLPKIVLWLVLLLYRFTLYNVKSLLNTFAVKLKFCQLLLMFPKILNNM